MRTYFEVSFDTKHRCNLITMTMVKWSEFLIKMLNMIKTTRKSQYYNSHGQFFRPMTFGNFQGVMVIFSAILPLIM